MKKELCIVMPVYNEQDCIVGVINDWINEVNKLDINFEIHVYNDGSKDNTLEVLNNSFINNDRIIIHNKTNSGHGPTIAMGYADNCDNFNFIFQVDSDNELDAKDFINFWKERNDYDFIIGNRKNRKEDFFRKFITLTSRIVVFIMYGKNVIDVNCPYRLMNCEVFSKYFKIIDSSYFAPNVLISSISSIKKISTKNIDIQHKSRTTGITTNKLKIFKISLKCFLDLIKIRKKL